MPHFNEQLPLPYLKIDRAGNILGYSRQAWEDFDFRDGKITNIVDEESLHKLVKLGFQKDKTKKFELNMQLKQNALALFDVYISWDHGNHGNLILVRKDESNQELAEKLFALQQRLASTDFELFEKKEQLDQALSRLNELSAPFIPISEEVCLIPVFGDITIEKVDVISANSLQTIFSENHDKVLIDFTAVGEIDPEGIKKLSDLFKTLHFMTGTAITVIGIKPPIAKLLHGYQLHECVPFEASLKAALKKHCTT